ncbi:E3 ubiquitin-protein ligase RNF115 isoform X1 [Micropterus dolomieu]|uniref:E3 ubiquitin-protein ligase RNF115 isoform X1 n=1 Tax=Micropterus dolomieu TaxID=147949 RepID=UPI001E8D47A1|nr:E3 ubiquitin-protein ligase RNF115 isoform X1 [Micropterus dolomieu]
MAEAAETPQHRFFCHCCKRETNPKLPDFVCPRCDSGFIEEVTEDSSLLQDSTSVASEDSDLLFSELWQLLFMERSALLSHPPSSESDPDDSDQVSAGQSQPSPEPLVAAEGRDPESPSHPEQESSSRPEQRPAVEGCVDMDRAAVLGRPVCQQRKPGLCTSCTIKHATVVCKPWRLCVGSGRSGHCHHRVVRTVGEHRSPSCRKGHDLISTNSMHLSRTDRLQTGVSSLSGGVFIRRVCQEAPLPPLLPQ